MDRKQIRLGFLGYGNLASVLASGLRADGLASIVAYNRPAADGGVSELVRRRALEGGVELAASPAELARRADVLIAAVPGFQATAAAESIAPYLGVEHSYLDVSSAAPNVKKAVAAILGPAGVAVADGAVESSRSREILVSGPAAQAFHDALVPWKFRCTIVGPDIGTASAIKILRSVVMKGIQMLMIESGVASARYGLQEEVFDSIVATFEKRGFGDVVRSLVASGVVTAERRFHEMEMSAQTLEEAGVEPVMTRSTIERLQQMMDMGLKEHFAGVAPDYRTALEAIDDRLRSPFERNP